MEPLSCNINKINSQASSRNLVQAQLTSALVSSDIEHQTFLQNFSGLTRLGCGWLLANRGFAKKIERMLPIGR